MPVIAKIKALEAVVDYEICKQMAQELLDECSKAKVDDTIMEIFFAALDRIALKVLSESEKQWLITTFVNCALSNSASPYPSMAPPDVETFIDAAVRLKQEVSAKRFTQLFSVACDASDAKLQHYIDICDQLALQTENSGSGVSRGSFDLNTPYWMTQAWGLLSQELMRQRQAYLNQQYPEMMPCLEDKLIHETLEKFLRRSESVKYPLSREELQRIQADYQAMRKFEKGLMEVSKTAFTRLIRQHREVLQKNPHHHQDQLQMLAGLRHAVRFVYGKYPYMTQMVVILGLLLKEPGRLAQVRTGEGKSTLFAILVAYLASCNKRVHWITSSSDLSFRDFRESKALFDLLGLSIGWVDDWQTHDNVYDQDILIGTNASFEFIFLNDALSDGKRLRIPAKKPGETWVAVIDEVDNLLIDLGSNSAIISMPARESQSWIYKPLVAFATPLSLETKITASLVEDLRVQLIAMHEGVHREVIVNMPSDKIKRLLSSAIQAIHGVHIEKEYDIIDGEVKIIDDGNTGSVQEGMSWGHGKHACVEVKHGLTPKPDSVTVASVSHPSYFNHGYEQVFGLTGTMGDKIDRQEVAAIYGLDCFDVPPHKPKQATIEPAALCNTQTEQYAQAIEEIADKQSEGHPVLVLLPNIRESKAFHQLLMEAEIQAQLINDRQAVDKDYIIAQAGHPGVVTVATNIASRGTDIRLIGKENPGLHVIILFLPDNIRVEEQMFGRMARQGQKGSGHMILCLSDPMMTQFIPDEEARLALKQHPDFLNLIMQLREKINATNSKRRLLQVEREHALFSVFLSFSTLYRSCLKDIESLSLGQLTAYCQTLTSEILEEDAGAALHPSLTALAQRGRSLLMQQDHAVEVNWEPFLTAFKQTYARFLQQEWALFYSELMDTAWPSEKSAMADYKKQVIQQFHDWVQTKLKQTVKLPVQGYLTCLFQVLGVSELHSALILEQESIDLLQVKQRFSRWEKELIESSEKPMRQIRAQAPVSFLESIGGIAVRNVVTAIINAALSSNKLPQNQVKQGTKNMKKDILETILREQNQCDRQRGFGFYDENRVVGPLIEVLRTANAAGDIDSFSVMQCLFNHARRWDNPIALKICAAMGIQQSVWIEFTVPRHEISRDQFNQPMFLAMQQCSVASDPRAAAQSYIQQNFSRGTLNLEVEDFKSSLSSC